MQEFTLSQKLHDALRRELKPFIPQVLPYKDEKLPWELALKLRVAVDVALYEAGEEGDHIRDALDGVIYERGAPAILFHNMPYGIGDEGISYTLGEALRHRMGDDNRERSPTPIRSPTISMGSRRRATVRPFFPRPTTTTWITWVQRPRGRGNPRHTPLFDADSLVEYLADTVLAKKLSASGRDASSPISRPCCKCRSGACRKAMKARHARRIENLQGITARAWPMPASCAPRRTTLTARTTTRPSSPPTSISGRTIPTACLSASAARRSSC